MTILGRYLLRVFLPAFLLCLAVFLFVLLMNYFLRLFNLAAMKGIPLTWIFYCFARLLPYFLSLALPMAFMVGLLLTLGQLSESGEVLAMRSAGISFREMLSPFFALALALTALLFYINHKASPEGFHSFKVAYSRAVNQVSRVDLEPKTLTRLGEWDLFADTVVGESLTGVRLVKREGNYKRLRIAAPRGRLAVEEGRGVRLDLEDGTMVWPNEDPESHTVSTFGTYRLFVPFVDYTKVHSNPDLVELNTFRIRERLASGTLSPQHRREHLTEAALRSAGAAAPFVLFWVACPLGLSLEKHSRPVGFAWSLAVIFAYYGLLAFGVGLGRRDEALSPWAPWLADAAGLAAGARLWWTRLRNR